MSDFQQTLFPDAALPLFTDSGFHNSPSMNELGQWLIENRLTTETQSNRHEIDLDGKGLINNRSVSKEIDEGVREQKKREDDAKKAAKRAQAGR